VKRAPVVAHTRSAPSPLVGWGGWCDRHGWCVHLSTPTPDSSPQGGGEHSLPDTEHVALGPGGPLERPLRTTAIVIYATLALLVLTIPGGLVNWSKNFEPGAAQDVLLRTAEALQSLSQRLGANWPYRRGREIFLHATGKRED
jgi:hypothetical protein